MVTITRLKTKAAPTLDIPMLQCTLGRVYTLDRLLIGSIPLHEVGLIIRRLSLRGLTISLLTGLPENLTSEDAQSLISLCALETVAKEKYSSFCDLFSLSEFKDFEYAIDLDKFYFTG